MSKTELEREILRLPVEERLRLAETIWDSLEQEAVQPPLPTWQRDLLDELIAAADADPEAGSSWAAEVKQRILSAL